MSDDRLNELAPCPFCGGAPSLIGGGPGNHYVRCTVCHASGDDTSRDRAIAAWNRRSALEPSPAMPVAEVREDDQYEPAAVRLLRGPLSKRASSAEFKEWQAREVIEYIDGLRALSPQKESGN
jgi:Lar family restriction alleviation protein